MVDLTDKADVKVKTLSGGQRRRLDLALGIVGDPEVLFLDEPTTGFDPSARRRAWVLVDRLRDLGTTILLTTHYMDEAENLADRVIVMSAGVVVAEGTPEQLAVQTDLATVVTFRMPTSLAASDLPTVGTSRQVAAGEVVVRSRTPTRDIHRLTEWALDRAVELDGLQLRRPSLEDVYLELVGGSDGDAERAADRT